MGPHAAELGPREGCRGVVALTARLEPWELALCAEPDQLAVWLDRHGSPVNVIDTAPMAANAAELAGAAATAGVALKIFFARKANKALAFVDRAMELGLGVDVASERELRQTLGRGLPATDVVVTAAIKPVGLLELCASAGPTVVLDNEDELDSLLAAVGRVGRTVPVALRLAPAAVAGGRETRFGLLGDVLVDLVERRWHGDVARLLPIAGVHFHVDGYSPADRIAGLAESFLLTDALRARGHAPSFVDFGGGIPISYIDDADEWDDFWREHRAGLRGERQALTFAGHGLGITSHAGQLIGRPNVYPYHQQPTRGAWLRQVLAASVTSPTGSSTVAAAARTRGLELRCEPGRSLVDGCGMTAARVEFRKPRPDGTWMIGLAMNRTQCRSTSEDFLVDPLLLRPTPAGEGSGRLALGAGARAPTGPIDGFLVGAYCIERELLTWRRLHFPTGVAVGDVVVFPNTAGYQMHILESASHQMPLARNLIVGAASGPRLDSIDSAHRRE